MGEKAKVEGETETHITIMEGGDSATLGFFVGATHVSKRQAPMGGTIIRYEIAMSALLLDVLAHHPKTPWFEFYYALVTVEGKSRYIGIPDNHNRGCRCAGDRCRLHKGRCKSCSEMHNHPYPECLKDRCPFAMLVQRARRRKAQHTEDKDGNRL